MSPFALNNSSLVFLPSNKSQKYVLTSIYIHTTDANRRPDDELNALYARVQQTASELVIRLVAQHVHLPFPQASFPIVVEGDGYNLHCSESRFSRFDTRPLLAGAVLKPWPYGKTLEMTWGKVRLVPSDEKWQVLFQVVDQ